MSTPPSARGNEEWLQRALILQDPDAPVMKLPPEILTTIFKILQEPPPPKHGFDSPSRAVVPTYGGHEWLKVLRVCLYWRKVAESCPFLWRAVRFDEVLLLNVAPNSATEKDCIRWLLNPARCTMLDVQIATHRRWVLWTVLNEVARMRRLCVEFAMPYEQLTQFHRPAPLLEVFALCGPAVAYTHLHSHLPAVFESELPSLRSLALSNFATFSTMRLPRLKQLHLRHISYDALNIDSFLDFLESIPTLEDLMFTEVSFWESNTSRKIGLPMLRRLAYIGFGPAVDTAALFQCLRLPPQASLSIFARGTFMFPFFPSDIHHLEYLHALRTFSLVFSASHRGECTLYASGGTSALRITLPFQVMVSDSHRPLQPPRDACFAETVLPLLLQAEEISLAGTVPSYREQLVRDMFQAMPSLRKLILTSSCDDESATTLLSPFAPTPQNPTILCPRLASIVLYGTASPWLLEQLLVVAKARRDHGHSLESIGLHMAKTNTGDLWDLSDPLDKIRASGAVQECDVTVGQTVPAMDVPQIARTQTDGEWEWPLWPLDPLTVD